MQLYQRDAIAAVAGIDRMAMSAVQDTAIAGFALSRLSGD